jgi:thymidylate kinase
MRRDRPKVVSFSGIDGAGKSTQIEAFCGFCEAKGYRFKLYTFWDDIVAFSRWRERLGVRVFKGDGGVGSPERPIQRRDKNVVSWPVILFRLFAYLADLWRLRSILLKRVSDADFLIFDRYIYDEWANLPLNHWTIRAYIHLSSQLVPKPDLAILLDADPLTANRRKPEYPLEFVKRNRESYLALAKSAGMMVIPPSSIEEARMSIKSAIAAILNENKTWLSSETPSFSQPAETQGGKSPFFSTTSSR